MKWIPHIFHNYKKEIIDVAHFNISSDIKIAVYVIKNHCHVCGKEFYMTASLIKDSIYDNRNEIIINEYGELDFN